jgi:DNA modification methylase
MGPGLKQGDLVGVPWMLAFALRSAGWYLRQEVIWHKPNGMPESVRSRCTRVHEQIFMFTKRERYYYNHEAIKEPAVSKHSSGNGFVRPQRLSLGGRGKEEQWTPTKLRNKRSVWSVNTRQFPGAHFAVFPHKIVQPCLLAGSEPGDVVLDPFVGTGTVGEVAAEYGRRFVGIELNPDFADMSEEACLLAYEKYKEVVS